MSRAERGHLLATQIESIEATDAAHAEIEPLKDDVEAGG